MVIWFEHGEDIAKFRIYHYRKPVGHVNIIEEDNETLCLADLFIKPEYQRLGLGKKMMKLLIQWARLDGYQQIHGIIRPSEGVTLDYLQEWYRRQGFKVEGTELSFYLVGKTQL